MPDEKQSENEKKDESSWSGWMRQVWSFWKRLFDFIFPVEGPKAESWRQAWAMASVASALCSFLNIFPHSPWLEFIPGWAIGEFTLIFLSVRAPLSGRVSEWRLSFFPSLCVWLPYGIRLVFGSPDSHPFSDFFEKKLGLKFVPQLLPPDVGDPQRGAIKMAEVCIGCTVAVVATATILAPLRFRRIDQTESRDALDKPEGHDG